MFRITDRPDMTVDVKQGIKQKHIHGGGIVTWQSLKICYKHALLSM